MSPADRKLTRELTRELRALGVSRGEAEELAHAAQRLNRLRVPGMSRAARQRIEARLPFTVEPPVKHRMRNPFRMQLRWVLAGSFAALAILVGTVVLFQSSPQSPPDTGEQKAREVIQPVTPDAQDVEEHVQELQQLQEQPTADKEEVKKAKDRFQRSYEEYRRRHSNDPNFSNPWEDYEQEWWWSVTQSSKQSSSASSPKASNDQR